MKQNRILLILSVFLLVGTTGCSSNNSTHKKTITTSKTEKKPVKSKKATTKKTDKPVTNQVTSNQVAAMLAQELFQKNNFEYINCTTSGNQNYSLIVGQQTITYKLSNTQLTFNADSNYGAGQTMAISDLTQKYYSSAASKEMTNSIVKQFGTQKATEQANNSNNDSKSQQTDSDQNNNQTIKLESADDAVNYLNQKIGPHNWFVGHGTKNISTPVYWSIFADDYNDGQILYVYEDGSIKTE